MSILFSKRSYVILIAALVIFLAVYLVINTLRPKTGELVTAMVEKGTVTETVSVSGFVEAKNTAELSFPVSGTITEVFVEEGATVKKGEVLATLGSHKLVASRNEAVAALRAAEANLAESMAGPTEVERAVTTASLTSAESNLEQVKLEQAEKVANAKKTLISSGLEAKAIKSTEEAMAPTVSGTYNCDTEGVYEIYVFSSRAFSGYSYSYSGLEDGVDSVYVEQPHSLGTCGLSLQFDENSRYNNTNWVIKIPNTDSSLYVTNKNAYDLALTQQSNALQAAKNNLNLVNEQATEAVSSARSEVVDQKRAAVAQAQARVAQVDADLKDRSIVAPFDGVITDVDVIAGEISGTLPVITLLAKGAFELTARIPEIDIRKVEAGQKVKVVFDAAVEEVMAGNIKYISPLATEIDGVAYFEATIVIEEIPPWIRSGLNADIEITTEENTEVLKLSKRFVRKNSDGSHVVTVLENRNRVEKEVEIDFVGNDGFYTISGLNEGDVVILE